MSASGCLRCRPQVDVVPLLTITGTSLDTLHGHKEGVQIIACISHKDSIVSEYDACTIRLWNISSEAQFITESSHTSIPSEYWPTCATSSSPSDNARPAPSFVLVDG